MCLFGCCCTCCFSVFGIINKIHKKKKTSSLHLVNMTKMRRRAASRTNAYSVDGIDLVCPNGRLFPS